MVTWCGTEGKMLNGRLIAEQIYSALIIVHYQRLQNFKMPFLHTCY